MSSQAAPDLNNLFAGAVQDGSVSGQTALNLQIPGVADALTEVSGVPPLAIQAAEIYGIYVVLDDSGSIASAGNEQVLRDGVNQLKDELWSSANRDEIVMAVTTMNKGVICPWTPLADIPKITAKNFTADGGTPLYHATITGTLALIAYWQQCQQIGAEFRGTLVVVSDGRDEANPYRLTTAKVATGLKDMRRQNERFMAAFMGIDDGGYTNFRQIAGEMGFPDNLILTPKNSGSEIRKAFQVVSRASKAASQGAKSFSQVASGGFAAITT